MECNIEYLSTRNDTFGNLAAEKNTSFSNFSVSYKILSMK